ncbi:MAG: hypothetical protein A2163_00705 [Actinobacteria bacterium RBG_13_35_12]|nr:MAG: hypothetical protein A2163_00705 [Actinobacteria bacterium RBG_13_35_12]
MITKYRKKPAIIEAIRWNGMNTQEIIDFVGVSLVLVKIDKLVIRTLEGDRSVSEDDYIIKGIKGNFYTMKPDIFLATYDRYVTT